jgi:hypothetical protein
MSRYAIDVVILPPEPVMDLALSWNQQLRILGDQSINLNKSDTLPHVSLLMGCLAAGHLLDAAAAVQKVAGRLRTFPLSVTGLRVLAGNHPVVSLDIVSSEELRGLQQSLIDALHPWITQDTRDIDLFDPPPADPSALTWINQFVPAQCGENFWPHITLGHGLTTWSQQPFTFPASRIAICHLGLHCTCRRILAEATLES